MSRELSDFIENYDPYRDCIWSLHDGQNVEGSISIQGTANPPDTARLRWFIVSDRLRGQGAGAVLMETAIDFCRDCGLSSVYLWTFSGLTSARHLYEKFGFVLEKEVPGDQWGRGLTEQRFRAILG